MVGGRGTHRQRWQTVPPIQSCSRSPTESLLVFSRFHYIFSALPSTLRFFSVALAGLKLTLSLRTPLPPKWWGYRCGSPHPVYATLGGIQDFLILGQQPTQFNYSSTPPFKIAIIFSFCVCTCMWVCMWGSEDNCGSRSSPFTKCVSGTKLRLCSKYLYPLSHSPDKLLCR